mgnify:CR=1 FL=1
MRKSADQALPSLSRRTFVAAAATTGAAAALGPFRMQPEGRHGGRRRRRCRGCGAGPLRRRAGVLFHLPARVPAPQPERLRGGRQAGEGGVVRAERLRGLRARHQPLADGERPRPPDHAASAGRREGQRPVQGDQLGRGVRPHRAEVQGRHRDRRQQVHLLRHRLRQLRRHARPGGQRVLRAPGRRVDHGGLAVLRGHHGGHRAHLRQALPRLPQPDREQHLRRGAGATTPPSRSRATSSASSTWWRTAASSW